ncbi:MAG: glycoside hydrolase family 3 N-terminal domain-containing protein [Steroidobacteraceae bacterium]
MSRIETLIQKMTLPEKLGQLTMTASSYAVTGPVIAGDSTESIANGTLGNLLNMVGPGPTHEMQKLAVEKSRLGIPLLIGLDIIHGHRTLFPLPLAEAAAFDPQLWERSAREAAKEGAADGLAMTFAPMLDVSRDLRWGRTAEGAGEDPWLTSQIAEAKVRGFQGTDLAAADGMAACAKHFVAYAPVNAGREYAAVDISERTLHEVHLPPFIAAVRAGVASIMPSFTDIAGIPMTAHTGLLRDYLRGELGFDGVVVSDYNAIGELIRHGVAADLADAAALALNAGVDIDMMADGYRSGLPVALQRGTVTMQQIDTAVRRVLRLKEQLGLFDDPYRRGTTRETAQALLERRALAREISQRSIVLLRNERDVLPLSVTTQRIAVLGPLADNQEEMRGCWSAAGDVAGHVTVLAGLRAALPGASITCATGVGINDAKRDGIAVALQASDAADLIVLCLGEAANMSGEAASRAFPELPAGQREFSDAVFERAHARKVPVIVVLFSGRPLLVAALAEKADALLAAWFLGSEAGNAIADVLLGKVSPVGRTPMTWPRALGQAPLFFGMRPTGRPENPKDHYTSKYLDVANDPLYAFGHGLTYGRFIYSRLRVSPQIATRDQTIEVEVEVRNDGAHAAEETLFLFTHDCVASVTRPVLELRGFAKARLKPGASCTVRLQVAAQDLCLLDATLTAVFEPGEVELLVGPSADRARLLAARVTLK